ncbi:MAG: aminotransferase class V-fold PLP-dependent enzyme [Pyrinomonadaceae bacterium]|nr:aminotransferase class V-fold PLP-dependent enzyme [Pyrinomonadaceae bacterium]MCX7639842.1 aminotransferase class V-fold PLP-dependent enzyme [Pyrinomonadaceae bacterium]MDW8304014.1 aminotransferase class V-fold PLP-dependent enzyme [Acidobacteriota bacterium]
MSLGDIPSKEFRKHGYKIIDWIADYLEKIEQFPVLSQNKPGQLKDSLPQSAPEEGEDFNKIFSDFEKFILPAVTHWNHPNFHGLFSTSSSAVGIFGEMLSAAFDMKAMLWRTAPASTELEQVTLSWLRKMLGLPESFNGIIYDTASVSSLHAIAMARHRILPDTKEEGMSGRTLPLLRLYCSEHAHSSIDKATILIGLGKRSIVKIESDENFRMKTDVLEKVIKEDKTKGFLPFCVVATIGTTSTTSIDDVKSVAEICAKNNLFLHVDAAYAGAAAILPQMRHYFAGWENADSIVINPHKWLFTPFDLSVLYVKDMQLLKDTFSLVPEYLKTNENAMNQMDYGIQLGRRFRALKLWFIIRYFGQKGMQARISEDCRLAKLFADWVKASPKFQLLAPVNFALVCFRAYDEKLTEQELNFLNEKLMNEVNSSGKAFISHTKIGEKFSLRLSIGSLHTQEKHLEKVWWLLNETLERLRQQKS